MGVKINVTFRHSVLTSQNKQSFFVMKFNPLTLYTQIMFIYSKKDMITYMGKQISISMNVTAGGAKQH